MGKLHKDGKKFDRFKQGYRKYRKASPVKIIKLDGSSESQPAYDMIDLARVRAGKKPRRKR